MHLCDIPVDRIHSVEIPTGLPLVYDLKQKKIRLLQEESKIINNNYKSNNNNLKEKYNENLSKYAKTLISKYNFGDSPDLLFKINSYTSTTTGEKVFDYTDTIIKYK